MRGRRARGGRRGAARRGAQARQRIVVRRRRQKAAGKRGPPGSGSSPNNHATVWFAPSPPPFRLGSTLATFTREAEQVRAPAQVPADGDSGLAVALLAGCAALDAPPQQYLDSFDALLRFVDASLDLYRVRR